MTASEVAPGDAPGDVTASEATRVPRGLGSLVVAVLGLADSVYLTIEHYSASTTLACPETAVLNCQKVTTSGWSHVGPIPVAVLGLVYFVVMVALCLPVAWRQPGLELVRVVAAGVGVAVALGLVYIELFKVDAICLYCTGVHVCALLLLAAVLWTTSTLRSQRGLRSGAPG